jgi:hypothetical protein
LAISPVRIDVGKIRSTGSKFAWEPNYVASVRGQAKQLEEAFKQVVKGIEGATPQVIKRAMEPTYAKSQVYCPYRSGVLRQSGYLEIVAFRQQPRVEMGYARGGQPYYAVLVHENLEMSHRPPTRARWLADAVSEDWQVMQDRIKSGVRDMFEGIHAH